MRDFNALLSLRADFSKTPKYQMLLNLIQWTLRYNDTMDAKTDMWQLICVNL